MKTWKMHYKLDSYSAICPWLYKIVRNTAMLEIQRQHRRNEVQSLYQSNLQGLGTPFDDIVRIEIYTQLHHAMKELSRVTGN